MSTHETWSVLHLFASAAPPSDGPAGSPDTRSPSRIGSAIDSGAIEAAVKECESAGQQVVPVTMLGHKADLGIVAVGPDQASQRALQTALQRAGCQITYSFVSRTEVSEYAAGVPEAMREARLHPVLPPEGMRAFCFYPMSKRRGSTDNWYRLDFDERLEMMRGHGASGREFRGRVLQLVTGSTGLDDWEWGVTLFGVTPDDLKDCVYQMRFDQASARFAEFGPFLTGSIGTIGEVLGHLGWR